MKLLIFSDSHGQDWNLTDVLESYSKQKIDAVIHLGDSEGSEDYIREIVGCPLYIIAGNCDFFSDMDTEMDVEIAGKRFLLTHGHYYGVNMGIGGLEKEAKARGFDGVLFGHTHRPYLDQQVDFLALNPGSISFPRQEGRHPSFAEMEIDSRGKIVCQIHYLT